MPFMSLLQPALALKIIHRLRSDELLKPSEAGDLLPSVFGLLKYFPPPTVFAFHGCISCVCPVHSPSMILCSDCDHLALRHKAFMSVLVLVSVKDLFLSRHILGIADIDTLPNLSSSKCKKIWSRKFCQNVGVVTLSFSHFNP